MGFGKEGGEGGTVGNKNSVNFQLVFYRGDLHIGFQLVPSKFVPRESRSCSKV